MRDNARAKEWSSFMDSPTAEAALPDFEVSSRRGHVIRSMTGILFGLVGA